MPETPLLQLERIRKSFGAVRALRGVSFELRAGEVHALLGENGAGKTTLIKVITGAHPPDDGAMYVHGKTVHALRPADAHALGIAAIYQQPALFPDLTVAENIALALEPLNPFRRVCWKTRRKRAQELLARVGAEFSEETEVRALSMPEQQLVEIAKALGSGARILIMDEPTASLTQKEVRLLLGVVRKLRIEGVGIIYISHRLEEIFEVADRVTVLRDGESLGTRALSDVNSAQLIRLMVGRDVEAIYPPAGYEPGVTMLEVERLDAPKAGVHEVSFSVRAGEILGFAGLVGAGRTELARVLFGIEPPAAGVIRLRGRPIVVRNPRDAVAHGIAYVPEDRRRHGVILEMPVAANATMAIHRRLFPRGWLRRVKEEALARDFVRELGIKTASVDSPAGTLSGGNQQKVALARWLATNPKVLILDEPTQGVDIGAKAEIHRILRTLAAEGMAIILISSDLPEVLGMSDRIAVMRGGRIVATLNGASADADAVMTAALGTTGEAAA